MDYVYYIIMYDLPCKFRENKSSKGMKKSSKDETMKRFTWPNVTKNFLNKNMMVNYCCIFIKLLFFKWFLWAMKKLRYRIFNKLERQLQKNKSEFIEEFLTFVGNQCLHYTKYLNEKTRAVSALHDIIGYPNTHLYEACNRMYRKIWN